MTEPTNFRLKLLGDTADSHNFQGYDGYNALAGFAWTLSLVANYVETGEIRQRGDFVGRHAVRGYAPQEGSVITDFVVLLSSNPEYLFGSTAVSSASALMYALAKRVIRQNIGVDIEEKSDQIAELGPRRQGDVEALVAIAENPIRRMHDVIGSGAEQVNVLGGSSISTSLNRQTEKYVRSEYFDDEVICKEVSVSAYNGNTGYGGVFDPEIGRVVPFSIEKKLRKKYGPMFSWGLDQYVNGNPAKIEICYSRLLKLDGRPKRYIIEHAKL